MIEIETTIRADRPRVWAAWNDPEDIVRWNAASDDWHTTSSTVDLREGGSFTARMEAKDGSMGFDFGGVYTRVVEPERIEYAMADGRRVEIDRRPPLDQVFGQLHGLGPASVEEPGEGGIGSGLPRRSGVGIRADVDQGVEYVPVSRVRAVHEGRGVERERRLVDEGGDCVGVIPGDGPDGLGIGALHGVAKRPRRVGVRVHRGIPTVR